MQREVSAITVLRPPTTYGRRDSTRRFAWVVDPLDAGARELPRAIREWREPGYDDFKSQTAWSLFNACTAAMRDRARSNPQQHAVTLVCSTAGQLVAL